MDAAVVCRCQAGSSDIFQGMREKSDRVTNCNGLTAIERQPLTTGKYEHAREPFLFELSKWFECDHIRAYNLRLRLSEADGLTHVNPGIHCTCIFLHTHKSLSYPSNQSNPRHTIIITSIMKLKLLQTKTSKGCNGPSSTGKSILPAAKGTLMKGFFLHKRQKSKQTIASPDELTLAPRGEAEHNKTNNTARLFDISEELPEQSLSVTGRG